MKILYIDCSAGAAGDMILGALLDAGASIDTVRVSLDALDLDGWELRSEEVTRGGIRANRASVACAPETTERSYATIVELLTKADLDARVRELALRTFRILAEAEARVHGVAVDAVHFHEVGALDSIVDTVGACAALCDLAPDRVITSAIAAGRGSVETRHGTMMLPAPAVTEILTGAVLVPGGEGELVTPTGAALLAAFTDFFGEMPPIRLLATGYGAGARETDRANVVRVLLGDAVSDETAMEAVVVAETNIDDMNPELVPYVIESLLAAGALDAWTTPIVMKKGRPAITLFAMFEPEDQDRVLDVIYRETTTLGVRIARSVRDTLPREWLEVSVEGHPLRVKIARRAGAVITIAPEYEEAVTVARATGLPLKEVYERATAAARVSLESPARRGP